MHFLIFLPYWEWLFPFVMISHNIDANVLSKIRCIRATALQKTFLQPNPASGELFLLYVLYANAQIIANYIVAKQSQETATILLVSLGNTPWKELFFSSFVNYTMI